MKPTSTSDRAEGAEPEKSPSPKTPVPSGDSGSGHPLAVEDLVKIGGAGIVLCYSVGLVVVNSYLLPYGVSDFNLLRARFAFTGLLVFAILAISTGCVLMFVSLMRDAVQSARYREYRPRKRISEALGNTYLAIMFFLAPLLVFRFAFGESWMTSLAGYVFNFFLGIIVIFAIFFLRRKSKASAHSRDSQATDGGVSTPDARRRPRPYEWSYYGILGMFLIPYIFIVTGYFSMDVFPKVPVQLGGTRGQAVQLLISHDSAAGLRQLGIPMAAGSDTTKSLKLLFTGDDFYLVESGIGQDFVLKSEIVDGIDPDPS